VPKKVGVSKHRESRTLGEAVGAELTRLRVVRGWSQQKLADQLGYTERYIGQLARRAQPFEPSLISRKHFQRCLLQFSELPSGDTATAENGERNRASLARLRLAVTTVRIHC
jgi:transcriptional regulator with XRE-family HTH domain